MDSNSQNPDQSLAPDLPENSEAFSEEFVACLESEATLLKAAIEEGASPMLAQARAMLWLDALVKMHAIGLEQSIEAKEVNQTAIWSRDLATLELSMALMQSVKPLQV